MTDTVSSIDDLNQAQTVRLVMDVMHRTIFHYALWFTEIRHQMGMEKALEALSVASEKSIGIQLNRLSNILGFEMHDGIPEPLLNMPKKNLPDYPCKSAGLVEYTYFARAIDPRIQTECIGCPPDAHPDDWYCAWRFSLK